MAAKINWGANRDDEPVLVLKDFSLRFSQKLLLDTAAKGAPGYQLVYKPTGHIMAEGLDIVAAVNQTYREQRVLDRVKEKPSLLSDDPSSSQLADFLADVDVGGQAAN